MNVVNSKRGFRSIILFLLWATPVTAILILAVGTHTVASEKDKLRGLASVSEPNVDHFLSLKCACSVRLVQHLKERRATQGLVETIHLIHPKSREVEELTHAGYKVEELTEESAFQRYNLQALPQLVVSNRGQIVYQGGYGRDQQHSNIYDDERIIAESTRGQRVSEYPLFGCANGKIRKQLMDLAGLKYDRPED